MLERLQSALKTVKESKRNYSLHFLCRAAFLAEVAVVGAVAAAGARHTEVVSVSCVAVWCALCV